MNILKNLLGKKSSTSNQTAQAAMTYQQFVDTVKLDPNTVDFAAFRLAYAASPEYDPYNVKGNILQDIRAFSEAVAQGKPESIIATSEQLLARAPLYVWAHVQASFYYAQTGNPEREAYHQKFIKQWWESVRQSGDGRSYSTAFVVVNLIEEHTVLNLLQAHQEQQRLEEQAGHFFDVWEVRNPKTGEKAKIYFNIDLVVKGVKEGRAQTPSNADIQATTDYRSQHPQGG